MAGCIFRARGEHFNVDAFLAGSSLEPDEVFRLGDPIRRTGKKLPYSGFYMVVSNTWGLIQPQVADAIVFLRTHQSELTRLGHAPGISDMRLDFAYSRRPVPFQCETLPHELLLAAGSLGISVEMSLYPAEGDFEDSDKSRRTPIADE